MPATDPNLEAQLRTRLDWFETLFAQGEIDRLVDTFYTEDAVVEGPGFPQQQGRDAFKEIFKGVRKDYKAITIAMDPIVHAGRHLVYAFITNQNVRNDGLVEIHRASIIWRRVDDEWLCQTDFFFVQP